MEPLTTADRDGHVLLLQLNRPDVLNALSPELITELHDCLQEADRDPEVRAVVLSGAGRAFCAGGDVSLLQEVNRRPPAGIQELLLDLFSKLSVPARMQKPVIAAVHGFALGAGFSLALLCDIRLAARKTTFGVEFAKMGIAPEVGLSFVLPRLIGTAKAFELILSARRFDAAEAAKMGLVNQVVEEERLLEQALRQAQQLAALPPLAVGLSKAALQRGLGGDLESSIGLEIDMNSRCYSSEDHREAVRAFLDKRKPVFKGR